MADDNMNARLKLYLSMLEESSIPYETKFNSMYNFFLRKKFIAFH